ncbi:zinc finger MYM-type protein 1-like [Acyrthosiphon pisum]|uniref:DUF4371 domain-containing protein n=1 Tax=Acyrthosiphon pisum TaxID=7029 RepID=A0A8R2JKV7_ACYPI|nr:zinc finger MYM-type protein 1-like [Acyrthosiphon pisum]
MSNEACNLCKRKRENLNMTNWTQHIMSCKKKKLSSGQSIMSFFKQKPSTSNDIDIGLNDEFHTENSDVLEIEDYVQSSSNNATYDLPKIEGLNDEIHTENTDELEIEDNALSSSNSVTHDLPKIEVFKNDPESIPLVISDEIQKKMFLVKRGSNDFKNITRTLSNHECSPEHMQSVIAYGLYIRNDRIYLKLIESANRQVADNRELLRQIIDALIYVGRQNIALRGHHEGIDSNNKGHFLELVKLLSNNHGPLKSHLEQIEKQFTFILRYVNEEGIVQERLVSLVTASDATGRGMFEVFCEITNKYNIEWKTQLIAQAYDGAASMQGQFSGLKTRIQNENPCAIYIWCFVGNFVEFMRARKRTAIFAKLQEQLYPNERLRRMKRFSTTRWTSHDGILIVINEKYSALLETLEEISVANDSDREAASTAENLIMSRYLQTKEIDFVQAINLIDVAKNRLIDMRSEQGCKDLVDQTKLFSIENNLTE